MINKNSLSFRIALRVLYITLSLFVLTFVTYYFFSREIISAAAEDNARKMAGNIEGRIAAKLLPMQEIPEMLVSCLEMGLIPADSIMDLLERTLAYNPDVFGVCVAFEPGAVAGQGKYFMPFVHRSGDTLARTYLGGPDYEYHLMDWYQVPVLTGKPYWSEPYYDLGGGNKLMSSYSVPFFRTNGADSICAGVAVVDIDLDWLAGLVHETRIFESGYAMVLSRNGMALAHPNPDVVMNESIYSYAVNQDEPLLREIGRELRQGKSGFCPYNLKGRPDSWIFYTVLPTGMLSMAVVYPNKEMFAELHDMNRLLIAVIVLGLIFLTVLTLRSIRQLGRPLVAIANSAHEIAGGNFKAELPELKRKDELKQLRDAMAYMQDQLSEYISNLTQTTAAKEKIESELRIARDIQMSMIPQSFPPFPDLPQIDLFAELKSAKEVGGDMYDFFLIDDRRFCFAIGDVSGKGVPASLFMAVTRTLLRSIADKHKNPSGIVKLLNKSLSANNDSCMFVTFFLGILDLDTGKITYTNAGHNPPVLIRSKAEPEILHDRPSLPVGLDEDFDYPEFSMKFHKGDKLFVYTDGVSEAENDQHQLFGEEAIMTELKRNSSADPRALIKGVDQALASHVQDFTQSDDITMMVVAWCEKED